MNRTEAFQILGIGQTKDERAIKNAYRTKLAVTNPEDNPEGFKELRAAYDEACRYAGEKEEDQEKAKDTTPSGLWVEKAAKIYANIRTRQDVELWRQLFEEDVFISLDEEENCRIKLLIFLSDHFKLPTAVWKLLDKKLSIVQDASSLREKFSADFIRYITGKCERGEDVDFSLFEGEEDADYDLFFRYYERCWLSLQEGKKEEAAQYLEKADALGIRHPVLEICRANYLYRQGKQGEAVDLLERERERYPEDTMINYNLAELLWRRAEGGGRENEGDKERAALIYRSLKEADDNQYIVNVRLAEWYCEKGQYREAKKYAEKVLVIGSNDSFMKVLGKINAEIEKELKAKYNETGGWEPALELCWCYLQDGKIALGIRLASSIEKILPAEKETEYLGLLAKLYLEQAEYEDSIVMSHRWQEALEQELETQEEGREKERNRDRLIQAKMIRVQCHYNLGFLDRENFWIAIEELKKLLTGTAWDIGIMLEMIQLYTEAAEYELGLELAGKLLTEYQVVAAHVSALEIYWRMGDAVGVAREGIACLKNFPDFAKAYEYMARLYLTLDDQKDLEQLLADAEKKGVKSVILDACRFQMESAFSEVGVYGRLQSFRNKFLKRLEEGQEAYYEEGLKKITRYLYLAPGSDMLIERALFFRTAHHYEEARDDYEKALALEPVNPRALYGLCVVHRDLGDYEKALFYIKRAILYKDKSIPVRIYADMGRIYALLGDYERALATYRQYEQVLADQGKRTDLEPEMAECYAQLGKVEKAAELYERGRAKNDTPTGAYFCSLIDLYMRSGMETEARANLSLLAECQKIGRFSYVWGRVKKMTFPYSREFALKNMRLAEFFHKLGWTELIFGTGEAAMRAFRKAGDFIGNGENGEEEMLCDTVFAFALCGDESQGKKYAKRLQIWLNRQTFAGIDVYYNRQKAFARMEFWAKYYTVSDEELAEILDRGDGCAICSFCVRPVCKELESARILLLLKQGKREAAERIKISLEAQPWDEYMQAIRHVAFGDVI